MNTFISQTLAIRMMGNTSVLHPSAPLPKPYGSAHGSREFLQGQPATEAPAFAIFCKISHYDIVPRHGLNHKPVKRMRLFPGSPT